MSTSEIPTTAEVLREGTRVRYLAPPKTRAPSAYGGGGTFVAPGISGVVVDHRHAASPYYSGGYDLVARIRFEYPGPDGKTLLSTPIDVLPGQPCEVV